MPLPASPEAADDDDEEEDGGARGPAGPLVTARGTNANWVRALPCLYISLHNDTKK